MLQQRHFSASMFRSAGAFVSHNYAGNGVSPIAILFSVSSGDVRNFIAILAYS